MSTYDPRQDAWPAVQSVMTMQETAVGSYGTFLKALTKVVEHGYWREFVYKPQDKLKQFERFADFLTFVGVEQKELLALLEAHGKRKLLAQVRDELGGDLAEHGANQHGGVCDTNSTQTDATYITRRLRRDHPDLHQEVMDGKLSANGAAVKAGIRKRYFNVPADDVDAAVAKLVKEFGEETVRRALGDLVVA